MTVGEKLNDNAWYFVKFEFLLGNLSIIVQKGPDALFTKLIANDFYNQDLWNVKLQNGSALLVGFNFTGCLMSGPNIDLTSANSTGSVYNGCPSTNDPKCSEGKFSNYYLCFRGCTCLASDLVGDEYVETEADTSWKNHLSYLKARTKKTKNC